MSNEIRRKEYGESAIEIRNEILDQARQGYLALSGEDGPILRPMNFARIGEWIYFHGAVRGERAEAARRETHAPACFVADQPLTQVPSTWRHPEMACPATTYYRSVMARGRLEVVEDMTEKAAALEALMQRYQPEGGYRPIRADDPKYRGPIAAVMVMRLGLGQATCKVKVGQNLEPAAREKVFTKLLERNRPGDYEAAREMARVCPDLEGAVLPRREGDLLFTDVAGALPIDQVTRLMGETYWAADRTEELVARIVMGSTVVLGVMKDGELLAFARAITDGAAHAWIYDVIVRGDQRGNGLGSRTMRALLAHPRLARVKKLHLTTREMMPFYRKLGFRDIASWQGRAWHTTEMSLERA